MWDGGSAEYGMTNVQRSSNDPMPKRHGLPQTVIVSAAVLGGVESELRRLSLIVRLLVFEILHCA